MLFKKGQTGGLVTGLIFGIAALVIATIIALTITQTLGTSDIIQDSSTNYQASNETGAYINGTGYTVTKYNASTSGFVVVAAYNRTNSYALIPAGNYTITSAGVLQNTSAIIWNNVSVTYTYDQTHNVLEDSSNLMRGNLTGGINNVSDKLPTVLLIAAIVLILGTLAVLVGVWQRMRFGSGGSI